MKTQTDKIVDLLRKKRKVYNWQLNRICFRYGARIFELRKLGYSIETKIEGLGVASFTLINEPREKR